MKAETRPAKHLNQRSKETLESKDNHNEGKKMKNGKGLSFGQSLLDQTTPAI